MLEENGNDRSAVKSFSYFIFNKPWDVLCQFTGGGRRRTLADFGPFPPSVYPAGRLDADSEGLVLLTDDGALKHDLLDPDHGHPRTYWAEVERIPSADALRRLGEGVLIEGRTTAPAQARLLQPAPALWERPVPVRFRKQVPTQWLELTITEGRNRQVRKMTAAVGYPTLRLVRVAIGPVRLGDLTPGESRPLTRTEIGALRSALGGKAEFKKNNRRKARWNAH